MTAETELQQNRAATTATADSGTAVHPTLQGKGGVGKSLVAAILAQYFGDRGRDVRCVDTDPRRDERRGDNGEFSRSTRYRRSFLFTP